MEMFCAHLAVRIAYNGISYAFISLFRKNLCLETRSLLYKFIVILLFLGSNFIDRADVTIIHVFVKLFCLNTTKLYEIEMTIRLKCTENPTGG